MYSKCDKITKNVSKEFIKNVMKISVMLIKNIKCCKTTNVHENIPEMPIMFKKYSNYVTIVKNVQENSVEML